MSYCTTMNGSNYFDTFRAALDAVKIVTACQSVLLHHPGDVDMMADEPLNYGHTRRGSFSIELLRNRRTRKYLHVVLYRMDSGRYELTTYIG
jgi:hypothetical protein